MVRVGGGWDTLEHFLSRHDPNKVGRILTCKLNFFMNSCLITKLLNVPCIFIDLYWTQISDKVSTFYLKLYNGCENKK